MPLTIQEIRRNKTTCPNGHLYTPENTLYYPVTEHGHGGRQCKLCYHEKYLRSKEKVKFRAKQWAHENHDKRLAILRRANIKERYGISPDEYQALFIKQEGRCAICGTHQQALDRRLDVDHDHETKDVRGLLCRSCNVALGHFRENIDILKKATTYLEISRVRG